MSRINDSISVVIPVYNSVDTLEMLIDQLKETLAVFDEYEMILVDDNSMDDSYSVIRQYAMEDTSISVIRLDSNVGQQRATLLGIQRAKGSCVLTMDDDLLHNPVDIIELYGFLGQGYDVVYGINRSQPRSTLVRRIGSKLRDGVFDMITDIPKGVKVSSFRLMSKEIVEKIVLADTQFVYISMEILRHTDRIYNVMVDYSEGAPSNYSLRKLWSLLVGIYINYSRAKVLDRYRKKFTVYSIASSIDMGVETCE